MTTSTRLVAAAVALTATVSWPGAHPATAGGAAVIDVVRVSAETPPPLAGCRPDDDVIWATADGNDGNSTESDPSVAVNPLNSSNVVAAWPADRASGMVAASSFDGGATWSRTVVPGFTICTGGTENHVLHARLSFGGDGRLYLTGETLHGFFPDPRSGIIRIPVATSTDGGLTWSSPTYVEDAPFSGLDRLAGEPDIGGAAVVVWHGPEGAATSYLSRTNDGGQTWSKRALPLPSPEMQPVQGVLAAPDGALYVFAVDQTALATVSLIADVFLGFAGVTAPARFTTNLSVIRSDDKGLTWSPPHPVTTATVAEWVGTAAAPNGDLYVSSWRDGPGGREIVVSRSGDRGETWDEPSLVASGAAAPFPNLAVNADGSVGLTYTAVEETGNRKVFARSTDGGQSWTHHPFDVAFPPGHYGAYQETAATDDGFASVYVRGGSDTVGPTDVFVARIKTS